MDEANLIRHEMTEQEAESAMWELGYERMDGRAPILIRDPASGKLLKGRYITADDLSGGVVVFRKRSKL